jgi:hypothetical protein
MKTFITLLLLAGALCAQTTTTTPVVTPVATTPGTTTTVTTPATATTAASTVVYPAYMVASGGGYTRNATPQAAEGWVSAALGLGAGNYSITTIDMTSTTSTIRTGFAKVFSQSGNFTLMGRVDAGVSTITPVIGSFSGGAILLYNMKGFSPKLANLFLLGELRISGVTATTAAVPNAVTPGFYFGVGKSF